MEKYITDALQPFSSADIQLVITMMDRLEEYGIPADDIADVLRQKVAELRASVEPAPGSARKNVKRQLTRNKIRLKCPDCGAPVNVAPVNVSKCTNVGGGYHSVLMCSSSDCRFTEMSINTMAEWAAGGER